MGAVIPIERAADGLLISPRLLQVVARATQPSAADRYRSVSELASEVRTFMLGGLHLPRRSYRRGELIVREGEPGDCAYMILRGRCRASCMVDGQEEILNVMRAGEVFGEMALLLDEPRAASVVAVDEVEVIVVDKSTLVEGLGVGGWTGALVVALAQRFRDLEQQVRDSGMRRSGAPAGR